MANLCNDGDSYRIITAPPVFWTTRDDQHTTPATSTSQSSHIVRTSSRLRTTTRTTTAAMTTTTTTTTGATRHNNNNAHHRDRDDKTTPSTTPRIRVVVANPRSFAYLTPERWSPNGTIFGIPSANQIDSCPNYNQWNTGLDLDPLGGGSSIIPCSYCDHAVAMMPQDQMTTRYATRDVAYLAGAYDLIVQEDHCATYDFQGECRLERSRRFYASLTQIFGRDQHVHRFDEVSSPHDHNLMYQSQEGQAVLFWG